MGNVTYKTIDKKTKEVYKDGILKGYIEHRGKGWYDVLDENVHYRGQGSSKERATRLLILGSTE